MKSLLKKKNLNGVATFYILYMLLFKSKNYKIKFYENFRTQILSEENFLQNNLDIYKLLEYCNIKRINPSEVNKSKNKMC